MRIRKRFPPSSSLSSSLLLSDPQLNRPPVVLRHPQGGTQPNPDGNLCIQEGNTCYPPSDPLNQPPRPLSDQTPTIGSARARWVSSDITKKQKKLEGEEEEEEEEEKRNDTRKGSIFRAEVGTGSRLSPPPLTAASHQVGRWCEGDYKVVPLKKRRGSFERRCNGEDDATANANTIIMEKEKKTKAKMKSKTNKKCVTVNANGDEQGGRIESNNTTTGGAKKLKRGNVIMEGSRCSRVNGRGWRCCQQTLVGYSLCEHHLGKGRLRSMTSVRSRAMANIGSGKLSKVQEKKLGQRLLDEDDDDDQEEEAEDEDDDYDDDEKKPLVRRKKRMKLGMVKARSISSLLGQTNNAVVVVAAVADQDNNNKKSGV